MSCPSRPGKPVDVMRPLPPDTLVVLCGGIGLGCSDLELLGDDLGSASTYFLTRNDVVSKVG